MLGERERASARAVVVTKRRMRLASTKMISRLTSDGSSHLGARPPAMPEEVSPTTPLAFCPPALLREGSRTGAGRAVVFVSGAAGRSPRECAASCVGKRAAEVSIPRHARACARWTSVAPQSCEWCLTSAGIQTERMRLSQTKTSKIPSLVDFSERALQATPAGGVGGRTHQIGVCGWTGAPRLAPTAPRRRPPEDAARSARTQPTHVTLPARAAARGRVEVVRGAMSGGG